MPLETGQTFEVDISNSKCKFKSQIHEIRWHTCTTDSTVGILAFLWNQLSWVQGSDPRGQGHMLLVYLLSALITATLILCGYFHRFWCLPLYIQLKTVICMLHVHNFTRSKHLCSVWYMIQCMYHQEPQNFASAFANLSWHEPRWIIKESSTPNIINIFYSKDNLNI